MYIERPKKIQKQDKRELQLKQEKRPMRDEFLRLMETTKALITYIDEEYVFDKASDSGCGGFDTYRSDKFDALIGNTKKAVIDVEKRIEMNKDIQEYVKCAHCGAQIRLDEATHYTNVLIYGAHLPL